VQKAHPDAKVEIKPGGRGDFVVTIDDERVWDKKGRDGRFPEPKEILARCATK